jgi:hypothetical protein
MDLSFQAEQSEFFVLDLRATRLVPGWRAGRRNNVQIFCDYSPSL